MGVAWQSSVGEFPCVETWEFFLLLLLRNRSTNISTYNTNSSKYYPTVGRLLGGYIDTLGRTDRSLIHCKEVVPLSEVANV